MNSKDKGNIGEAIILSDSVTFLFKCIKTHTVSRLCEVMKEKSV